MMVKLARDILPGEFIRHEGRWVQIEKLEPGILACWVHHADGTIMLTQNTRVAVVKAEEDIDYQRRAVNL